MDTAKKIYDSANKERVSTDKAAVDHYNKLVKEFGKKNVTPIKRDKEGAIIGSKKNFAIRAGVSAAKSVIIDGALAGVGMLLYDMPIPPMIYYEVPILQRNIGSINTKMEYSSAKSEAWNEYKKKKK